MTDAQGNKIVMEYDAAGQLVKETNQAGETRSYTYTPLGKVQTVTNEAGLVTSYTYALGGQLQKVTYPDGSCECFKYDANGNVIEKTDKNGYIYTYAYNSLNQLVRVCDEDGAIVDYTYDCVGNVTSITDGLGNVTTYEYSLTGQLVKVTDAQGNHTEYDYDVNDQLIQMRQYGEFEGESEIPGCQITKYERNPMGQVVKVTDALGQSESFKYNKRGELIEKLDKEGYHTRYGYTVKGDISHIQYEDGREVKLSYNPLRKLQQIEDWLGITKIESDSLGRAVKVTGPEGKEVSYAYDGAGRRTAIIYPDSTMSEYRYDAMGRLSECVQGDNAISYSYNDRTGYLEKKSYPNGMETAYTYTKKGQLESLIHKDTEGILDEYTYRYDIMGNRTGIVKNRRGLEEESGMYTYAYDALGRLENVAKDGKSLRTYAYDAFGNRTSLTEAGGVTRYAYNALNQLVSKTDSQNETSYRYDRRGNLSLVLENGLMKNEYIYGALNRLEEARNSHGEVSKYIYNGLGNRVGKETGNNLNPTSKIDYIIDLTKEYHNLLQSCEGTQTQTYIWDGNVAGRIDSENHLNYYLQDELGSAIRLADSMGIVKETYGYDEFGQDIYGNQNNLQPFGYTGYQFDNVAGTYYAQVREYRAGEGRFCAEDWVRGNIESPYTLNQYDYCWNNPVNYVDLNGKWALIAIGAFVGAVVNGAIETVVQVKKGNIEPKKILLEAAKGAVTGAVAGACPGMKLVATAVVNGAVEAVGSAVEQVAINGSKQVDVVEAGKEFVKGFISSGIAQKVSGKLAGAFADKINLKKGIEDVAERIGAKACVKQQLQNAIKIGCKSKIAKLETRLLQKGAQILPTIFRYTGREMTIGVADEIESIFKDPLIDSMTSNLETIICELVA